MSRNLIFNENISSSSAPIAPMGGKNNAHTIMQIDKYPIVKKTKSLLNEVSFLDKLKGLKYVGIKEDFSHKNKLNKSQFNKERDNYIDDLYNKDQLKRKLLKNKQNINSSTPINPVVIRNIKPSSPQKFEPIYA